MSSKSYLRGLIAFALLSAPAAMAGELCVVCSEPNGAYRCAIEGDTSSGPPLPGVQLLCIKELATRGAHKSCSIDRTAAAGPCDAALVTLARPADGTLQAVAPPVERPVSAAVSDATTSPPAQPPVQPTKDNPPATVEALAKAAAEQSKKDWDKTNAQVKETTAVAGQQLEKAGNAVGNAVKKSWDCVASLFAHC